jgi:hypothetical protein
MSRGPETLAPKKSPQELDFNTQFATRLVDSMQPDLRVALATQLALQGVRPDLEALAPEQHAEIAAAHLGRLQPGRQPLTLFSELARLVVLPTIEIIPLRQVNGQPEVLMAKRPDNDRYWPSLWHLPGVVVLATDPATHFRDLSGTTNRIFEKELGGAVAPAGEPNILEIRRAKGPERGDELSPILWIEVKEVGDVAEHNARFIPLDEAIWNPPQPVIDLHISQLERVAPIYQQHLRGQSITPAYLPTWHNPQPLDLIPAH